LLRWSNLGRAELKVMKLGGKKADRSVTPNAFEYESGVIGGTGDGHDTDRAAEFVDLVVVNGGPLTPEFLRLAQGLVVGHRSPTLAVAHWKKVASFAVALNCGIGSSSLNAVVNAFCRLHLVRGAKASI
jgi:hypothetical protein